MNSNLANPFKGTARLSIILRYKKERLHGHSSVPTQKRKRSSQYTLEDQVRLYQMSSIRSSEQVLEVARKYTSPQYNLFCNNCEQHFALFCTTGEDKSYQIQQLHLTFVCKLRKCFCCFTASGTSNSGNGYENLYARANEEEDEENRLLEHGNAKRRKQHGNDKL